MPGPMLNEKWPDSGWFLRKGTRWEIWKEEKILAARRGVAQIFKFRVLLSHLREQVAVLSNWCPLNAFGYWLCFGTN